MGLDATTLIKPTVIVTRLKEMPKFDEKRMKKNIGADLADVLFGHSYKRQKQDFL